MRTSNHIQNWLSLALMAASLAGCADDVAVEQQKWHVSIQANRPVYDENVTRSLYLSGSVLKANWTGSEVVKVYNSSGAEVGTLTASTNLTGGSTTLTGDITTSVNVGEKLYIWSPSKTPDYTTQDGTVEGISAKDYIKAEITVQAKDNANHVLKTDDAEFSHQQSFTKFTVTPAIHSLQISASGYPTITATKSGTTESNEFYVAMPNTGTSTPTFTFTGKTNGNVSYTATKSKLLANGNYYTASMDLMTTPNVTAPTAKTLTYNGSPQDLVNAGNTTGGTLEYSTDNSTWSENIPQGTNAGNYTVYYRVVGDANYNDVAVTQVTGVSIARKSITVSGIKAKNKTYDASTTATLDYTAASFNGLLAGDNLSITATGTFSDANAGTGKTVAISGLTLGGSSIGNYILAASGNQTSTTANINKAASSVTSAPTANTLTYNGSEQSLVAAGTGTGGSIQYCLTENGTYSTAIPTGTNANSYTVYYKVVGDANHNDSSVGSVNVSISPKTLVYGTDITMSLKQPNMTNHVQYNYLSNDPPQWYSYTSATGGAGRAYMKYNLFFPTGCSINIEGVQNIQYGTLTYDSSAQDLTFSLIENRPANTVVIYEITITGGGNYSGNFTFQYENDNRNRPE